MLDHSGSYQASRRRRMPVPALPPYLIEPIWQQFSALIPERRTSHPLGCHRPRIPDRVVFEKLVQILVFGCAYERIADGSCSATTLRDRRDEWIELGAMEALREMALEAYDRIVGLELPDVAVAGGIPKGPCRGEKDCSRPWDGGRVAREYQHSPGSRLRLRGHPRAATRRAWSERRDLPKGRACPARCDQSVGRGADRLLAPRSQEARVVHGEAGKGGGVFGGRFGPGPYCQAAHPGGLDPLPLGRSSFPTAITYLRSLLASGVSD